MKLTVALLQLLPTGSLEGNLEKGIAACTEAKAMGSDIALFGEMWSCGYALKESREAIREDAVEADSPFVTSFARLAKEVRMAIAITYLEADGNRLFNTMSLFDRSGKEVLRYRKVHTCDFDTEQYLDAGDDFFVVDLDTDAGVVKVGAMICYDREFPESARILMLKGAELILVPNACPMEINRLSQLRARSFENMVGIATANYPEGKIDCNGHSCAFDGVAYWGENPESRDTCILEAPSEEGVYIARFDLSMMREYRAREVHGNAYRRPRCYGIIVSDGVNEPCIRSDRVER
ncbi:MAG TPA: carbon-nitrogen hydrolase family protein [Sphaerochaeta sp.]|jgi:predicted amidohydrolase|nr:carbon-nitrogen hydrolase family protein [Spirochaetota bacterium]NLV61316.1 carbon-nitrogen hydrolase family protein [Spirochaetales bacterium]HOE84346.1 carbon-nitrogen hydrolase family protein [Sphaerochaeta sp.]HOQ94412.1 carbon-nitrogen hydrolase family protein [Sphaerochaeta sp.]HPK46957.1 carbon-nitrogen hydrolase family protein [Sphaerochaeta sp.]